MTICGAAGVHSSPLAYRDNPGNRPGNTNPIRGDSVNKAELVDLIADRADISKASAARVLDATLDGIVAALRDGDPVALVGFGTFSVKQRAERQGRNPKTGEPMTIAASRSVGFKPGKMLRDALS